ncbi:E2F transcription factor-like E2FF isoform X2 [Ziziphus jujuba]|uniref:E2F transcription factor-like E2FF isoform X2 n=1 Tax=Ziziphus jujuba TaxID=326968 RepID=A0A6P3ZKS4_ZIZJJ|nr:E2F transcription factor-like E2FF isoform X2 [Ziziphus jujuba]
MSSLVSLVYGESETRPQFYSRKEKSLGVLCSNFLGLYNGDCAGTSTVGLDDAANRLGVERRRMYDVVNILESIGVVARKAKNQYTWKGLEEIPRCLEQLKKDGLKENFNSAGSCSSARVSNENQCGGLLSLNTGGEANHLASLRKNNKSDKSLALLSQNFIKLFLCSNVDMILLDNAAKALPGDADDETTLRTKVRRLYDVANVFSSLNLIEKIRHSESGKPAYRWLGWKGKLKNGFDTASEINEPKKRVFGSDITNYNSKRNKTNSVVGWKSSKETSVRMHNKLVDLEHEYDENELKQHPRHKSTGIDFGPFAPVSVLKARDAAFKNVKQVQDMESLASTYRPQYHNQALYDLFAHYMEAWKSWLEATRKQQTQQIC